MKRLLIVISVLSLCGCKSYYKDVSIEPKYSEIIGKTVIARQKMRLYGIRALGSNSSEPDSYVLTTFPGFGGNYILTRAVLPIGTAFRIDKVLKCRNCPFGYRKFEVRVENLDLDRKVFLGNSAIKLVVNSSTGDLILNPELFDVLTVDREQ